MRVSVELAREIRQRFAALGQLPQDIAGAHRRVLHIGAGFAFEAQRLARNRTRSPNCA